MISRQKVHHIFFVLDTPGARGLGFIVACVTCLNFAFPVPVMVTLFTGKLKMKSMGKTNSTPCGFHLFGCLYGNNTPGNRERYVTVYNLGMGIRMASCAGNRSCINVLGTGSLLLVGLFSMTVPACLMKSPHHGFYIIFRSISLVRFRHPEIFMTPTCSATFYGAVPVPSVMALLTGIGKMKGMGESNRGQGGFIFGILGGL